MIELKLENLTKGQKQFPSEVNRSIDHAQNSILENVFRTNSVLRSDIQKQS